MLRSKSHIAEIILPFLSDLGNCAARTAAATGDIILPRYCAVCGRTGHLERHHMVPRSAGQLVLPNGHLADKPTITLCGFRNAGGCHGKAHSGRLHFRWVEADAGREGWYLTHVKGGHLEYLLTDEPESYLDALKMDGWRPLDAR